MLATLLLSLAATLSGSPQPYLDDCDACKRGKTCKPHVKADKAALAELKKELSSKEALVRGTALRKVAALADAHENAPGEDAAEVLAEAAKDDDQLKIRALAIDLLCDGQHPEVAVETMVVVIRSWESGMWSLVGDLIGPKGEHGTAADAMDMIEGAMRASRNLRDDRIVKSLANILRAYPTEMRGEPVAMATVKSLLDLGTRDAVDAVIDQLGTPLEEAKIRQIHTALVMFAKDAGLDDDLPSFNDDDVRKAWPKWFKKAGRELPKKLGKWEGPEEDDEDDDSRR